MKIADEALALIVTLAGIFICPLGIFVIVTGKSAAKSPLRVTTQRTSAVEPSESELVATLKKSRLTAVTEFADKAVLLAAVPVNSTNEADGTSKTSIFALPEKRITSGILNLWLLFRV